jgi:uncharacterized protein YacL
MICYGVVLLGNNEISINILITTATLLMGYIGLSKPQIKLKKRAEITEFSSNKTSNKQNKGKTYKKNFPHKKIPYMFVYFFRK